MTNFSAEWQELHDVVGGINLLGLEPLNLEAKLTVSPRLSC